MVAVTDAVRGRARPERLVVALLVAAALIVGVLALVLQTSTGDYDQDAGPAIRALTSGDLGRFFALQPLMGSLSLLLRAPFALVAAHVGGGELAQYRAGVLVCVLAACALGLALARLGAERSATVAAVVLLAVFTPASRAAVRAGHPEEILGAALCVAAVLLARRRPLWAGVALGLALATKQWAVLAVIPVLLAAPQGKRVATALTGAGVAALLTLPLIAGDLGAFSHTSNMAATAPPTIGRTSIWFPLGHPRPIPLHLGAGFPASLTVYTLPAWLARGTHPLILLVGAVLAVIGWRRRSDPLALLALVLLARCVLDPVDNEYYHLPFLLALLAYETVSARRAPLLTLFSVAGLWLTYDVLDAGGADPHLTNSAYLAWTAIVWLCLLREAGLMRHLPRVVAAGGLEPPTSGL